MSANLDLGDPCLVSPVRNCANGADQLAASTVGQGPGAPSRDPAAPPWSWARAAVGFSEEPLGLGRHCASFSEGRTWFAIGTESAMRGCLRIAASQTRVVVDLVMSGTRDEEYVVDVRSRDRRGVS